jgi:hypothetical protein
MSVWSSAGQLAATRRVLSKGKNVGCANAEKE